MSCQRMVSSGIQGGVSRGVSAGRRVFMMTRRLSSVISNQVPR